MAAPLKVEPDLKFIREISAEGGDTLKKCFQCATCSVVCSLSPQEKAFPRKEMLWAGWGLKDRLLSDPDIWLCHQCNDCSANCPRGAKPGDTLAAIRNYAFRHFAFPAFLGKAAASKSGLIPLLLVPIVLLAVMLHFIHGGTLTSAGNWGILNGPVNYSEFFPHKYLEGLFISGNILIFAFLGISLFRFWNGLKHEAAGKKGPGFIPSVINTAMEFVTHTKFRDCDVNKPRATAHMLVAGGFIGAFITTGFVVLVLMGNKILGIPAEVHHPVFELPHPVKILGVLSGAAMIIGGWMMLSRRSSNPESVGPNLYADKLFLNMIFLTGLTGLLTYIGRLIGIPILAYAIYYIHLVIVFFLLWYAPYSKFAHIFYRTLALVWAKNAARGEARGA